MPGRNSIAPNTKIKLFFVDAACGLLLGRFVWFLFVLFARRDLQEHDIV